MESLFEWVFKGVLVAGLGSNIFFIKRWMTKREKWEETVNEALTEDGGILNRDKFFSFCEKCLVHAGLKSLNDWRQNLGEKGGPLAVLDHINFCEHVIDKVVDRMSTCFLQNNQLLEEKFKVLEATLQRDRVSIRQIVREVADELVQEIAKRRGTQ